MEVLIVLALSLNVNLNVYTKNTALYWMILRHGKMKF